LLHGNLLCGAAPWHSLRLRVGKDNEARAKENSLTVTTRCVKSPSVQPQQFTGSLPKKEAMRIIRSIAPSHGANVT
jgi:hypothetical protein